MVSPELLEACRRGDPRAFEALVEQTHRRAYTLALRLVDDRQEAEDVTQDAYMRVFRSLKGFRGDAAFETWLYRIVTNAALNHLRRRGRFGNLAAEPEYVEDAVGVEDAALEGLGARDEIERGLARLPEGMRAVIVLKEIYGLSCREIGDELGLNEGAVKVRLHRARKRLRELVYGQEEVVTRDT